MIIYSDFLEIPLKITGISLLCVPLLTAALYLIFKLLQGFFGNKVPCVGIAILLIIDAIIIFSGDPIAGSKDVFDIWSNSILLSIIPLFAVTPLFIDTDDGFFAGMWNSIKLNLIIMLGATALFDWLDAASWIGYVLLTLCAVGIVLAWIRDDY